MLGEERVYLCTFGTEATRATPWQADDSDRRGREVQCTGDQVSLGELWKKGQSDQSSRVSPGCTPCAPSPSVPLSGIREDTQASKTGNCVWR